MRIPAPAELQLQVNSCGLFMELGTLELAKEKNPAHQLFYFIQLSYFYLPKLKFTCTAVRADITSQKGVPQPFPSQDQLEETSEYHLGCPDLFGLSQELPFPRRY